MFQPTLAPGWKTEDPGPKTETQMGRAFRELGIEWIAAHSPQAKGRVERCFGTLQNRLVKALRKAKVKTLAHANQFLEQTFLPEWHQRFTVVAANAVNAHRPLGNLELAGILSFTESRRVANDYTVAWKGGRWQIPGEAARAGLRGASIRIEQHLDGTMKARVGGTSVPLHVCEPIALPASEQTKRPARRFIPAPGKSSWMQGFHVRKNTSPTEVPPISAQLRSPSGLPPPG